MIRVALTGGIGSGKSTVARAFASRGAIVVDADRIARDIVEPGQPALTEIRERFGPGVIQPDGTLDRPGLAAVVFGDARALADLNSITHPRIAQRSAAIMAEAPAGSVVVYDMPLLVEQRLTEGWDQIVVVETPMDLRLERLGRDRGMASDDARARVAAQASDAERRAVADYLIVNDGTPEQLEADAHRVWDRIVGATV